MLSQELQFDRITVEDGLSYDRHWSPGCVLIDSQGLVWFSTVDGLNRWDGYSVEVFKRNPMDSNSIASNFVAGMAEDRNGDIWIGTVDKGIVIYHYAEDRFSHIPPDPDNMSGIQINAIARGPEGHMWIGTANNHGVFKYDMDEKAFESIDVLGIENENLQVYRMDEMHDGGIIISGAEYFVIYEDAASGFVPVFAQKPIEGICKDFQGRFWYSLQFQKGIHMYDPKTKSFHKTQLLSDKEVNLLKLDPNGKVWAGAEKALYKISMQEEIIDSFIHDASNMKSFTADTPIDMEFDSDGNLFYMTRGKGAGSTNINKANFNTISKLLKDDIFMASDSVLKMYSQYHQHCYNNQSHITTDISESQVEIFGDCLELENGETWWIKQREGKLYKRKNHKDSLVFTSIPGIMHLTQSTDGKIWTNDNLKYYDPALRKMMNPNDLIRAKGVQDSMNAKYSIYCKALQDGRISLGSTSGGLYIYNPADSSYAHFKEETFQEGEISSSSINYIYESSDGEKLYLASNENVNIWNKENNTFSYLDASNGLLGRVISMIEDHHKFLWILSSTGLYKFEGDQMISYYGKEIGFNFKSDLIRNDMILDSKGFIIFNSSQGVFRFHPDSISNPAPKDVLLMNLFIDRKEIHPQANGLLSKNLIKKPKLRIPYKMRNVGFEFVSTDGRNKNVDYYYRLKGYQDDWLNIQKERRIHFTNLDDGTYTFEVKAKSAAGVWTKNTSEQIFTIKAAWYDTWIAYLLYAFTIGSILYGLFKYRIAQLTKYETLRTKISSDLHDDVGTLLTSLAMQSEILGATAEEGKKEKFSRLQSLSREAMSRMRDTVWAIDSRKDNLGSLTERMKDFIYDILEDRDINHSFDYSGFTENSKIPPDIRQNVYLIFKEAISNVVKHSNATEVRVELKKENNSLILDVVDNGSVNPEKIKHSGSGMSNMKWRAERIGGTLSIQHSNGYSISLDVPL